MARDGSPGLTVTGAESAGLTRSAGGGSKMPPPESTTVTSRARRRSSQQPRASRDERSTPTGRAGERAIAVAQLNLTLSGLVRVITRSVRPLPAKSPVAIAPVEPRSPECVGAPSLDRCRCRCRCTRNSRRFHFRWNRPWPGRGCRHLLAEEVAGDDRNRNHTKPRDICRRGLESAVAVAQEHVEGISDNEELELATARSVRPLLRKSPATSDMFLGTKGNDSPNEIVEPWVNVPLPLPRSTVTASMNGSATTRSRCPSLVKLPATIASGKNGTDSWIRGIHERNRLAGGECPVAVAQEDGDRARVAIDHGQVDLARCR